MLLHAHPALLLVVEAYADLDIAMGRSMVNLLPREPESSETPQGIGDFE
jgi:hypothetical protein